MRIYVSAKGSQYLYIQVKKNEVGGGGGRKYTQLKYNLLEEPTRGGSRISKREGGGGAMGTETAYNCRCSVPPPPACLQFWGRAKKKRRDPEP